MQPSVPFDSASEFCRVRLKPDGTRWRTGGEVKEKLVNGVGSQYSHTTSERCVSSITNADAHTSAASSRLNWNPADSNGLVRFGERRNLVSARVPSHFKRSLLAVWYMFTCLCHCSVPQVALRILIMSFWTFVGSRSYRTLLKIEIKPFQCFSTDI
jgi:hypothetical protein